MSEGQVTRTEIIKRAAYITPIIMTRIYGHIRRYRLADGVGLRLMKGELLLQLKAIALAAIILLWLVSTAVIIAELSGGETGVARHISDFVGAARKWHVLN